LPTALVGLAARRGIPDGRLVSFGLAGGLRDELECGTVIDATRVVDESGRLLWEGDPLGVEDAREGTILAATRLIDDPGERRRLGERRAADAVDMESGPLAQTGQLAGCIRVVSDTPSRTLQGIEVSVTPEGKLTCRGFARAFVRNPRGIVRASVDGHRALRKLRRVAEGLG
jgi:nucleoside phosphorylase